MREEVISEQFESIIKAIQVPEDTVERIVQALKESFHDKNKFRDEAIQSLRQKIDILRKRMDQAYTDKLDKKITEEFWLSKQNLWQEEIINLDNTLCAYTKAEIPYYESGYKILELGRHAHSLYLKATHDEKRELLNLIKSNYSLRNGSIEYSLKKPFNWMTQWASNPTVLGN